MLKLIKCLIGILVISVLTSSCSDEKPTGVLTSLNANPVKDSIRSILAQTNPINSTFENSARAKAISQQLDPNPTDLGMHFNLAKETLHMGKSQEALDQIIGLIKRYPELEVINNETIMFHRFIAICHLRLAEQKNCQENHTDESCIVPITGSGIHRYKTASENAIRKYESILKVFPEDFESIWLLNVAYMTLGSYPSKVPNKWLVNINKKSKDSIFKNIATFAGVDDFGLSGGVIVDDFNNDGLLDIICSTWGFNGKLILYQNNGPEGFTEETEKSQLNDIKGGLNIKQVDYNNDGYLDFYVMRGAWRPVSEWGILPNSLVRNNGDGTFTDVTISENMYSTKPSQSAEWFDFNNDGWLDLFVANETPHPEHNVFPCELYENLGGKGFKEVSIDYGIEAIGYFKGSSSGDVNNDGLLDLYISNLNGDNHLYLNKGSIEGKWQFENIAEIAEVTKPNAGFACWFVDLNNDGYDDILNFAYDQKVFSDLAGEFAKSMTGKEVSLESSKVYINQGSNNFLDLSDSYFPYKALGTMGCNYGDINNDGFIDFFLGTGTPDYRSVVPNRFFLNKAGQGFEDLTFEYGLGHIQKGHGIAFADLNNDGHQDIYAVMGGAFEGDSFHNALFSNPANNENQWIKLKLQGTESNRSAIGALIKIDLDSGAKTQSIYKRINSGSSFGANPLAAHIGVEKGFEITELSIKWPNGKNEFVSYGKLDLNKLHVILESGEIQSQDLKAFPWKETASDHSHHH